MWNWGCDLVVNDGFDNKTAYLLGWEHTTMPSAAVGLNAYRYFQFGAEKEAYMKFILSKNSALASSMDMLVS